MVIYVTLVVVIVVSQKYSNFELIMFHKANILIRTVCQIAGSIMLNITRSWPIHQKQNWGVQQKLVWFEHWLGISIGSCIECEGKKKTKYQNFGRFIAKWIKHSCARNGRRVQNIRKNSIIHWSLQYVRLFNKEKFTALKSLLKWIALLLKMCVDFHCFQPNN